MRNRILGLLFVLFLMYSCTKKKLPILGYKVAKVTVVDGKEVIDSIYPTIPNFEFTNQEGLIVNQETTKNKIYVADFFFVTCPTICPRMKKNLLDVYAKYKSNPDFLILSHTIDPEHDSIAVLKDYAERLGADAKQWHFLRGDRETTYELAEHGYYSTAMADSTEPGGFVHSGGLILVDKQKQIRGIYDGTNANETKVLIQDIETLMNEKE
jgi:protein SCO1/2